MCPSKGTPPRNMLLKDTEECDMIKENEKNEIRLSKYILFTETSKGDYLIYSTKNDSFIKCCKSMYMELSKYNPGDKIVNTSIFPEEVITGLIDVGVLCSCFEDQDYLSKLQYISSVCQHRNKNLSLVLVPTLDCNFSCPYCFEVNKRSAYMSSEIVESLIKFIEVKKHEIEALDITWYGGEPLMAWKIIVNILNRVKRLEIPLGNHAMITNGYNLTPIIYKKITNLFPLKKIQVTLDGDEERHNSLRSLKGSGSRNKEVGTFRRIIRNINSFAKDNPDTKINIRINIDETNKLSFQNMVNKLTSVLEHNNVSCYPGFIRIENEEKTQAISPTINKQEALRINHEHLKATSCMSFEYPKLTYKRTCTATHPNAHIIGPEGEIYRCWNDVSDKTKVVGNIKSDRIQNPKLYFRYLQSLAWYNDSECRACSLLPICSGKCAWYAMKNKYDGGKYELCSSPLKVEHLKDEILESYYYHKLEQKS